MRAHNLRTVFSFEFIRTITKVHFWALSLGIPLLIGAVFWLMSAGSSSLSDRADSSDKATYSFTYSDASGLIDAGVAQSLGGHSVDDAAGAAAVREGRSVAHFTFPKDPVTQPITAIGQDVGLFDSARYSSLAQRVLSESVAKEIGDPQLSALATARPDINLTTYADGRPTGGLASVIAPGIFLVLFYLSILLLGAQMLNVTVEEKENRVTEMILTTIEPALLIIGKVLALVLVGLVQMVVFTVPLLVLQGLVGRGSPAGVAAPSFNGATVVLEPVPILVGGLLFLGGFVMFTGLLVAIGSVMPTAKDASAAFSVVVIAMFLPLYSLMLIVTDPHSVVSQVLTWFPLTTPVTALVRNATGSLGPAETVGVLVLLYGFAALFLGLGVRLFRAGSISYDMRLDIRKALGLGRRSR